MSFFAELKRRKVFRVGAAYLIFGWAAIEVSATVLPQLDFPESAAPLVTFLVLLGFPIALVLSWVFEFTDDGLRFDARASGTKRVFASAGVLGILALGWFLHGRSLAPHESAPAESATTLATPPVNDQSIAVLPFVDMSQSHDLEFFSDGLSEELMAQLSQISQLRVIARTSSFSFKGKEIDLGTIARTLRVSNVLEGSVRRSGETIRITAQLIRAVDSSQLWSKSYDRQLTDVLKVQDDIARAVVDSLKLKLLPDQKFASPHQSANPDAYNHYLLGNQFYNRANSEGYRSAVEAYRKAISLDPEYAAAYAGLAYAEVYAADDLESADESNAAKASALAAADRAIALAPGLAEGFAVRGWMRSNITWDWDGAQQDFEKALSLNPNSSEVRRRYGQLLGSRGRLTEAIAEVTKATKLDPVSAPAWSNLGYYLMCDGQLSQAMEAFDRALAINPGSLYANSNRAQTLLLQGKPQEALEIFSRSDGGDRLYGIALAEHALGHNAESKAALDDLVAHYGNEYAMQIADVFALLGNKEVAFEWLERAYVQRDGGLSDIKFDPLLVGLRDDPRFTAILKKLGLPE